MAAVQSITQWSTFPIISLPGGNSCRMISILCHFQRTRTTQLHNSDPSAPSISFSRIGCENRHEISVKSLSLIIKLRCHSNFFFHQSYFYLGLIPIPSLKYATITSSRWRLQVYLFWTAVDPSQLYGSGVRLSGEFAMVGRHHNIKHFPRICR
jgi:hypothetical protein